MRRLPITALILVFATALFYAQGQGFQEKAGFELEAQHFYEQADAFYDAGAMEPAAEYYAAAFEADPQHAKALYNLALTNFQLKNYGKAEIALEKLFQLNPADTTAYELYGHTLLQKGQPDRAIDCFNMVLYAEPTDTRYVHRALAKISTHHTNDALNDFDEALRLNPQNFDASLGKGIALMELGQPKLAAAWLDQALSIRQGDATALTNLGVIKYQMGEKAEAMEAFREALQSSRQSDIFLARAKCYLLDHNYSDAIADAREAMLLDGENAEVYAFIGDVEVEKGAINDAIESFGIAIDLKPGHANYYLCRAEASIKGKMYYDAVSDLYRALDLEPYNPDAKVLLQTAYRHIDADVLGQSLSENNH
ncbi:MAG: tetratricopeptide repeat protein [Saprospiraceae bacterium]|nr:tetratricopeptide repeat protein [Saprospiraceae bacterium]